MEINDVLNQLLTTRGLTTPKQISEFFHPRDPATLKFTDVGLSSVAVKKAIQLIKLHIKQGHIIAVYGDYDVDGICSTAILWETLNALKAKVFPHIPHRRQEGYGLSTLGIDHCLSENAKLIITVDNGIVAHEQIAYAKDKGADIIIIDHHEPSDTLPPADVILHSTQACAAGLTYFFTQELIKSLSPSLTAQPRVCEKLGEGGDPQSGKGEVLKRTSDHLSLATIATVCDLIPLLGINRSIVKYGLPALRETQRPGLLALFTEANIDPTQIDTYNIGFIIGPRLNAMGRLEHALDSLRLLCTSNIDRAHQLAATLGATNRTRQQLTLDSTTHAISSLTSPLTKLLIVSDPSYDQGVIGLIAAKLVEKYHRPAIAVSVGETESKASARSVPGFHITEHIRTASHLLVNVGGHMMAAGFTVTNEKLEELTQYLISSAETSIDPKLLEKTTFFDIEIPLSILNLDFYQRLQDFAPFGLSNPRPVFLSKNVNLSNFRRIGKTGAHLKFMAGAIPAIAFNYVGDPPNVADIYYSLDQNTWNGITQLQLIVKDLHS